MSSVLDRRLSVTCTGCDADLDTDMRFCPFCGCRVDVAPRETVVLADLDDDSVEQPTVAFEEVDEEQRAVEESAEGMTPVSRLGRRLRGRAIKILALALGLIMVAAGGYLGYSAYVDHREYKAQVAAAFGSAEGQLDAAVRDLQDVKRTVGVRAVAERASQGFSSLDQYLPALGEDESARARTVGAALAEIGSLSTLDADTLGTWKAKRPKLVDALDNVGHADGQQVGTVGSDEAIAAVDRVVRRGRSKLADWRDKRAAAVADRRSDLATFDAYAASMNAQIRSYASMRDDTAEEVDTLRNDASNTYLHQPVYDLFSAAMYDRIGVRDAMNGLAVPAGLESQHAAVVSAVGDGIAGMDQLLGALDDNNVCDSDWDDSCYLFGQPLWEDFQDSSDSVTQRYGQAVDAWRASLPATRSAIEGRPLPKRPVV